MASSRARSAGARQPTSPRSRTHCHAQGRTRGAASQAALLPRGAPHPGGAADEPMKPGAGLPVGDLAPLGEPHQRLRVAAAELRGHDAAGAVATLTRVVLAGRGHADRVLAAGGRAATRTATAAPARRSAATSHLPIMPPCRPAASRCYMARRFEPGLGARPALRRMPRGLAALRAKRTDALSAWPGPVFRARFRGPPVGHAADKPVWEPPVGQPVGQPAHQSGSESVSP